MSENNIPVIAKACIDLEHEGEGKLNLAFFYRNPRTLDGRLNICIACSKRRATKREYRFRDERVARGLPCVPTAEERAEKALEREIEAEERRQEQRAEDRYQHAASAVQPSPAELRGVGFHLNDVFEPLPTTERRWWIGRKIC